ncbi:asialoglycoprotein receptor 2-like, partial [Carassius gibelio]|uniref:asialoglycoprotein receptor 2-like n=1 Tax=Carassius gibelio TaxID=101364 RepID=UPI0022780AAD
ICLPSCLSSTGSVSVMNRKHRAAEVRLSLLCFLLTAVIVLCVCFTTERNQLLTQISNLSKEREKTLTKYEQILNNNNNRTEECKQILSKYEQILTHNKNLRTKIMTEERDKIIKASELQQVLLEQDQQNDPFKWIYYNFSFYYISSELKSWSDSRRDCQQRGADLVIINSPKEQDFVQTIAVSDHFWIGLGKVEGKWKWISGTIMTNGYWSSHHQSSQGSYCALTTSSASKPQPFKHCNSITEAFTYFLFQKQSTQQYQARTMGREGGSRNTPAMATVERKLGMTPKELGEDLWLPALVHASRASSSVKKGSSAQDRGHRGQRRSGFDEGKVPVQGNPVFQLHHVGVQDPHCVFRPLGTVSSKMQIV